MERIPVAENITRFPASLRNLLSDSVLYDSSCSDTAQVWLIDRDDGYYLKSAPAGTLKAEGLMTGYFHQRGMAAEVLHYEQADADWLLTRRLPGEDCISLQYLEDPRRLCDTLGQLLRMLHETDPANCPIPDRTAGYIAAAAENRRLGKWHPSRLEKSIKHYCADDAWAMVREYSGELNCRTLIHGDYCLPNILLDHWNFSGFIDLGAAGMGDRHIDLYWCIWSLGYNLKTDQYRDRFLDAYGRDKFDPEILRAISAFEAFG